MYSTGGKGGGTEDFFGGVLKGKEGDGKNF